jgi:RimJ/RimL family protein N-acetyltransferase
VFAYPYLTAMIVAENTRSIRVAEGLGMTRLRDELLFDVAVVVHSVERGTFYAADAS